MLCFRTLAVVFLLAGCGDPEPVTTDSGVDTEYTGQTDSAGQTDSSDQTDSGGEVWETLPVESAPVCADQKRPTSILVDAEQVALPEGGFYDSEDLAPYLARLQLTLEPTPEDQVYIQATCDDGEQTLHRTVPVLDGHATLSLLPAGTRASCEAVLCGSDASSVSVQVETDAARIPPFPTTPGDATLPATVAPADVVACGNGLQQQGSSGGQESALWCVDFAGRTVLHMPTPDPTANKAAEVRWAVLEVDGTPQRVLLMNCGVRGPVAVTLDGRVIDLLTGEPWASVDAFFEFDLRSWDLELMGSLDPEMTSLEPNSTGGPDHNLAFLPGPGDILANYRVWGPEYSGTVVFEPEREALSLFYTGVDDIVHTNGIDAIAIDDDTWLAGMSLFNAGSIVLMTYQDRTFTPLFRLGAGPDHLADLHQVVPPEGQEPPQGTHAFKTERLQRAEDGRLRLEIGVFNNWNTDPPSDTSTIERWALTTDLVGNHTAERLVQIEIGRHSYGGGGQDQERLSDGTLLVAYVEGWDGRFYPDLTLGVHDSLTGFSPLFTATLGDADGLFEPYSVGIAILH
jgi:hypothetical protein